MSRSVEVAPLSIPSANPMSAKANRAVARCCAAFDTARKVAIARGANRSLARKEAREAYRAAMPPLDGAQNIRDFVACIAYGMLILAISRSDADRLLEAAQNSQDTQRSHPIGASTPSPG